MQVNLTIKNYRCFPDDKPASILLDDGLTALLGVNNSGKSSVLKFFYEFRNLFLIFRNQNSTIISSLYGTKQAFNLSNNILDINEIFSNTNKRDLNIEFEFKNASTSTDARRLIFTIYRGTNNFIAKIFNSGGQVNPVKNKTSFSGNSLISNGVEVIKMEPVYDLFQVLSSTIFIPSYRNAINIGSKDNYFDISIGQKFIEKWRDYKTGASRANSEAVFRLTEDIKKIFRFEDLEINPSSDNQTLQIFINGKSSVVSQR